MYVYSTHLCIIIVHVCLQYTYMYVYIVHVHVCIQYIYMYVYSIILMYTFVLKYCFYRFVDEMSLTNKGFTLF